MDTNEKINKLCKKNHKPGTKDKIHQWCWLDDDKVWKGYSIVNSYAIEQAYQSKKTVTLNIKRFLDDKDTFFVCDPVAMKQTNSKTNHVRKMERLGEVDQLIPVIQPVEKILQRSLEIVGWNKNCCDQAIKQIKQFEKELKKERHIKRATLADLDTDWPYYGYLVLQEFEDGLKVSGYEDLVEKAYQITLEALTFRLSETSTKISIPSDWKTNGNIPILAEIQKDSPKWKEIETEFKKTSTQQQITKIERVENSRIWQCYQANKNNKLITVEKNLWHGTRATDPKKVWGSKVGFDMRFCQSGMWGIGTYFAVNSAYSVSYSYPLQTNNEKQFFYAKVLIGDSTKIPSDGSLRKPPEKPTNQQQFVGETYDSVEGFTGNSVVYILYEIMLLILNIL